MSGGVDPGGGRDWSESVLALVHEVRNYLSLARAQAQIIAMGLSADPAQDAARVVATIDRLDTALQRFKRLEAPLSLHLRPCSPAALLHEVAGLFAGVARQRGITLAVDAPPDPEPEPIAADPDLLREVLLNLVRNALEATPGAGVVRLRQAAGSDGVTLSVCDQGAGIAPETAARIFEPFFTTKREGSGLGLAICRRIVAAHGGRIWFESAPGQGTTFYVWLPRRREAPPAPTVSPRTA